MLKNEWYKSNLPSLEEISYRIKKIIPSELDPNGYVLRDIGTKTVFVMLYCGCVGKEYWIRPATITCMDDNTAQIIDFEKRIEWLEIFQSRKAPKDVQNRWYMPNTREPIRDETIRELIRLGCVIEREGLATTSPVPRYTLDKEFALLFDPSINNDKLDISIAEWRNKHLSAAELARITISKRMAGTNSKGVLVTLPNGETRLLAPGPSSILTKEVIEIFAPRYMKSPAAILISESARKLIMKDDDLCKSIGIEINVSTVLPDIILMELGGTKPLLFFIECVATDGPINEKRRIMLEDMAIDAGFDPVDCKYITVFSDRTSSVSKRLNPSIAWGTFIWYASEPENLVYLHNGKESLYISDLHELWKTNE